MKITFTIPILAYKYCIVNIFLDIFCNFIKKFLIYHGIYINLSPLPHDRNYENNFHFFAKSWKFVSFLKFSFVCRIFINWGVKNENLFHGLRRCISGFLFNAKFYHFKKRFPAPVAPRTILGSPLRESSCEAGERGYVESVLWTTPTKCELLPHFFENILIFLKNRGIIILRNKIKQFLRVFSM